MFIKSREYPAVGTGWEKLRDWEFSHQRSPICWIEKTTKCAQKCLVSEISDF